MSRALTVLYLALIFLAFGLAGANDLREEERLSVEGYALDHELIYQAVMECER